MSVAVNMLWCVPGEVGGSEEYFVRQLLGLAEFRSRCEVTAFVPRGFVAAHPDVDSAVRVVESTSDCRSRLGRIGVENTWLARHTKHFDVVHHGGGTMPTRSASPSVVTIHDLQYLTYPEYFTRTKRAYLGRRVPNAARRATVLTVPSEHVKSSVATSFGVDPGRSVLDRRPKQSCARDSAFARREFSCIQRSRIRTRTTSFCSSSSRVRGATLRSPSCSPEERVSPTNASRG
jgi:alpha-1,3-rhamnosyl/mannosyltransferase